MSSGGDSGVGGGGNPGAFGGPGAGPGDAPVGAPGGPGVDASDPGLLDGLIAPVPVIGPINALIGMFGGKSLGELAQGDTNPAFGTGVSGADSGVGVGGGPGDIVPIPIGSFTPVANPDGFGAYTYTVDPSIVKQDLQNNAWGNNYPSPYMPPMSMYGQYTTPFSWNSYLRSFK